MAIDWDIDEHARVTTVTVNGALTLDLARQTLETLYTQPAYWPPMGSLWDLRDARLDPRPGDVPRFVEFIQSHRGERGANRTALVVSRATDFGISRMYQAYAETALPLEIRVFKQLDEARSWLASAP